VNLIPGRSSEASNYLAAAAAESRQAIAGTGVAVKNATGAIFFRHLRLQRDSPSPPPFGLSEEFILSNQGERADGQDNGAGEGRGTPVMQAAPEPKSASDRQQLTRSPNKKTKPATGSADPTAAFRLPVRPARRITARREISRAGQRLENEAMASGSMGCSDAVAATSGSLPEDLAPRFDSGPVHHFPKNETWCLPVHPRFSGRRVNTLGNACRRFTSNRPHFQPYRSPSSHRDRRSNTPAPCPSALGAPGLRPILSSSPESRRAESTARQSAPSILQAERPHGATLGGCSRRSARPAQFPSADA